MKFAKKWLVRFNTIIWSLLFVDHLYQLSSKWGRAPSQSLVSSSRNQFLVRTDHYQALQMLLDNIWDHTHAYHHCGRTKLRRAHAGWTQGASWGKMQELCAAGWSFSPGASSRCSFLCLLCSCPSLCEPGSACLTPTPACLPATRRKYNLDEEYGIVFCRVALSTLVWSSCTNWLLNTTYRGS